MFSTSMGSVSEDSNVIYLRPETAQGIFVNFLNVQKTGRMKIPFGIAQIGKAFRNEIVARQFIFRMREFEQMEMQFFIRPGTQKEWYEKWKETRLNWHKSLGIPAEKYRFHDHMHPSMPGADPLGLLGTQMAGPGSILAIEMRDGFAAASRVAESLQLITHAVSLGGVDTLIQHPAALTHRPVPPEARPSAGLLRISVGLESLEDLADDLEQAIARV
jgi:hypothetical protein